MKNCEIKKSWFQKKFPCRHLFFSFKTKTENQSRWLDDKRVSYFSLPINGINWKQKSNLKKSGIQVKTTGRNFNFGTITIYVIFKFSFLSKQPFFECVISSVSWNHFSFSFSLIISLLSFSLFLFSHSLYFSLSFL